MELHTNSWPSQPLPAYAGIGSRETPPGVLDLMVRAASQLAQPGLGLAYRYGWRRRPGVLPRRPCVRSA